MTSKTDDTTHTPGPWTVTHQVNTDYGWDVVANGETIAQCGYTRDTSHAYAANARLIAAAPDLAGQLDQAAHYLDLAASHVAIGNPLKSSLIAVAAEARAALAKAGAK